MQYERPSPSVFQITPNDSSPEVPVACRRKRPFGSTAAAWILAAAAAAPAQATIIEILQPTMDSSRRELPSVTFRTTEATGHSGCASLGTNTDPWQGTLDGAYLAWLPDGLFLARVGAGVSTVEILQPGGLPVAGTFGVAPLASAHEYRYDDVEHRMVGVFFHAGALFWTNDHVLLLGIHGDAITTAEVRDPLGAPIAGAKGVSNVYGFIRDANPDPAVVDAHLAAAVILYTADRAYAIVVLGGTVRTVEIRDPASAPIASACGVLPIGPGLPAREVSAFLWTPSHLYLVRIGDSIRVTEVRSPEGSPIEATWGMTRAGYDFYVDRLSEIAIAMTRDREYLVFVDGESVGTAEVKKPNLGPITSNASILTAANTVLRQISLLHEFAARYQPPGQPAVKGSVVGLKQ